jgi:hypothetical protein
VLVFPIVWAMLLAVIAVIAILLCKRVSCCCCRLTHAWHTTCGCWSCLIPLMAHGFIC